MKIIFVIQNVLEIAKLDVYYMTNIKLPIAQFTENITSTFVCLQVFSSYSEPSCVMNLNILRNISLMMTFNCMLLKCLLCHGCEQPVICFTRMLQLVVFSPFQDSCLMLLAIVLFAHINEHQ